jgi:hypothetical protein
MGNPLVTPRVKIPTRGTRRKTVSTLELVRKVMGKRQTAPTK